MANNDIIKKINKETCIKYKNKNLNNILKNTNNDIDDDSELSDDIDMEMNVNSKVCKNIPLKSLYILANRYLNQYTPQLVCTLFSFIYFFYCLL